MPGLHVTELAALTATHDPEIERADQVGEQHGPGSLLLLAAEELGELAVADYVVEIAETTGMQA